METATSHVLVVDDDPSVCHLVRDVQILGLRRKIEVRRVRNSSRRSAAWASTSTPKSSTPKSKSYAEHGAPSRRKDQRRNAGYE